MHKGFDFQKTGGFPFDQQTLEYLQEAYSDIADKVLTEVFGDNVIVCGCEESGSNVSSGWVVLNGELLPFRGTVLSEYISIREEEDIPALIFADNTGRNVKFSRYVTFGTSTVNYKWEDIKKNRLTSLKDMSAHLNGLPKTTTSSYNVPGSNVLATAQAVYSLSSVSMKVLRSGIIELDSEKPLHEESITIFNRNLRKEIYLITNIVNNTTIGQEINQRYFSENYFTSCTLTLRDYMPGISSGNLRILVNTSKLSGNSSYKLLYMLIQA